MKIGQKTKNKSKKKKEKKKESIKAWWTLFNYLFIYQFREMVKFICDVKKLKQIF